MSKYIFCLLILLSVFCSSCNKSNKKSLLQNATLENISSDFRATEFMFKGHYYIYFRTESARFETGGIVHNPDCKCFYSNIAKTPINFR